VYRRDTLGIPDERLNVNGGAIAIGRLPARGVPGLSARRAQP
jgi:acetyl-CoA acetyltransferase